nr:hypothetical protein [Bacteroidota bacterium]
MKKNLLLLLVLLAALFFNACETDFDIDAEWKEISIVYGLLDQRDTTHYFRINKAFLGGNALEVSKIEDSSSYKNSLEVILYGVKNNDTLQTIVFDTCKISNKDTGVWYNPYMQIYKGTGTLDETYDYNLYIKNMVTGKEIYSSTKLVRDFTISDPKINASFVRGFTSSFTWRIADNGARYEPTIRFHYAEIPAGTNDTTWKFINWAQAAQSADQASGSNKIEVTVQGDAFYSIVDRKLNDGFQGTRIAGLVDYIVSAAGEEYHTYMLVNEPSTSIVQEKPEYTNIENGLGFLSSRYQKTKTLSLNPLSYQELVDMNIGFVMQ